MQPAMAIPIETISTGQCFQAWNEYAETGHKICTRNDPKISCPVNSLYILHTSVISITDSMYF